VVAFAAMHALDVLYVARDRWLSGKPMKRRDFITLLGGATAWPLAARARLWRIGVLMPTTEDDGEGRARVAAFFPPLYQIGITCTAGKHFRKPTL